MAVPITISAIVTASNTDVLSGTRLDNAPSDGRLTIELIADLNDATNNFVATVQLPDSETPWDSIAVPGVNPSLAGVMDDFQKIQGTFDVFQGGHTTISLTETGTAICFYRVTFTPAR